MSWNAKQWSNEFVQDLRLTLTKARSCSPALWLRRLMLFMAQPVQALNGLRYGASVGTRGSMKVVVLVVWSMKNCYQSRTEKLRKLYEIFPSRKIWKVLQSSLDAHLSNFLHKKTFYDMIYWFTSSCDNCLLTHSFVVSHKYTNCCIWFVELTKDSYFFKSLLFGINFYGFKLFLYLFANISRLRII